MKFYFNLNELTLGVKLGWHANRAWGGSFKTNEQGKFIFTYQNFLSIDTLFFTVYIPLWKFTKEQ